MVRNLLAPKHTLAGLTLVLLAGICIPVAESSLRSPRRDVRLPRGQNPIIQTKFTADPAPLVYKGTIYLFTSHDEDDAAGFIMRDWLLYTSTDMVNWTDHGAVASLRSFKWADPKISGWGGFENGAWAPQVIERNGKFYMYCPVQGRGIGVLVADSPFGPFTDPIGKPLIGGQFDSIDPTVLIDKGQAYLYWGNPNLWYVKLNRDMITAEGAPIKDPSVAKKPGIPDAFQYQEGPWVYQRKGKYYMAYASTCCPEGIAYAMSNSPTGPWVAKGPIMIPDGRSSGNHPGIIDYKGKTYVFGFNYTLNRAISDRHRERRSVCVAELTFDAGGSIDQIPWWDDAPGVPQLSSLNPYRRNEAETMSWSSASKNSEKWSQGVRTEPCEAGGMDLGHLKDGSVTKVSGVDFGSGAKKISMRVASGGKGGQIEVRLDRPNGPKIGQCTVTNTGGWQSWTTVTSDIQNASGIHDLYFVYVGESNEELFSVDWWSFAR